MKAWAVGLVALQGCLVLNAGGNPANVVYCDLIKSPSIYLGRDIRVRAIYRYGFEIQQLESPDCCVEKPVKIWVEVEPLDARSRKLLHRFPKGMGLALGVFTGRLQSGGPFGDGGYRLRFTVSQIEAVEAVAHPSARNPPSWAPQNCSHPGEPNKAEP